MSSEIKIGTWEKHTKGIGLKLLKKFGFNGRLGAREDGISKPIEVSVKPSGIGKTLCLSLSRFYY
jgi:tuftelin-interacting protein 11